MSFFLKTIFGRVKRKLENFIKKSAFNDTGILDCKIAFILDEVSQIRSLLRHVVADKIHDLPLVVQTRSSFNYQWEKLPTGEAMLSNQSWKDNVKVKICKFTGLPSDWFIGKKVLDAGCGLGRWTYGFGKLGVGECISFDVSESGFRKTNDVATEFNGKIKVFKANILEELKLVSDFDLVWCYGVLHHTGDTYKGFKNLVNLVKPGGYLFLMLYGEPRLKYIEDFNYYHEMFYMRCLTRNMPFEDKVEFLSKKYPKEQLHGYFDAISPEINDLYREDEIVSWLRDEGFEDIKRTLPEHPNHHIIARKKT